MKHSLRRVLCLSLFLVMLVVSLLPLTAGAEDYSAELNSLNFNITLLEDGSAYILETREVVFSGDHEFTRLGAGRAYTGPRMCTDWEVFIDGVSVPQLDAPDHDNRPENTFAVETGDGKNTVYVYFRQQGSGTRVFQIGYRVENAVKLYSDVGEFSWNLTGDSAISDIGTLTATLTVPEGIPAEDFFIWAHGPLNGNFDKDSDNSALLRVENVPLGTIVDIRTAMPADCFYGGWEQEGEALPDILAEEQALSDSANAKREEEQRWQAAAEASRNARDAWREKHPILSEIEWTCYEIRDDVQYFLEDHGITLLLIFFLGIPVLLIFTLGKIVSIVRGINTKRFRSHPTQSPQYYRDLPDDCPAPVVDKLIHFYDSKFSTSRQLSAALLELNLKKLIQFQTTAGDAELLLNEQLGEEIFPSDAPQEAAEPTGDQEHTPGHQELLWNFLRKAADGRGRISIKALQSYIKDNRDTSVDFRHSFWEAVDGEFKESVKTVERGMNPHKASKLHLIFPAAVGIVAMLICMFSTLYDGIQYVFSILVGLAAFVVVEVIVCLISFVVNFVIVNSTCRLLDQQSEDALALWEAFGRFLDDFTTFEDKELPEFSVWREYMAYAVAMGKGQKVAQALALKYPEAVSTGTDTMDDDMYRWLQDMSLYDAMDSISREVEEVRMPVSSGSSSDNDNWSDGGGGGGGFSDSGGGSDSGSTGDFID